MSRPPPAPPAPAPFRRAIGWEWLWLLAAALFVLGAVGAVGWLDHGVPELRLRVVTPEGCRIYETPRIGGSLLVCPRDVVAVRHG